MTTLLHTHEGAVPMHTAIENEINEADKAVYWEALRGRCMTVGCREALDEAMRPGHVVFDYLWFVLVVIAMVLTLGYCAGDPDQRDPGAGSHIPEHVQGGRGDGLR